MTSLRGRLHIGLAWHADHNLCKRIRQILAYSHRASFLIERCTGLKIYLGPTLNFLGLNNHLGAQTVTTILVNSISTREATEVSLIQHGALYHKLNDLYANARNDP